MHVVAPRWKEHQRLSIKDGNKDPNRTVSKTLLFGGIRKDPEGSRLAQMWNGKVIILTDLALTGRERKEVGSITLRLGGEIGGETVADRRYLGLRARRCGLMLRVERFERFKFGRFAEAPHELAGPLG